MHKKEPTYLFAKVKTSRVFTNIRTLFELDKTSVPDVGCSEGHYLACFGPDSMGLTIIDEHVEIAKEYGLNVINKNVEDPDFSLDKTFDAVWANNFFEHMESPHQFLIRMKKCLKPDGVLILGVPVLPYLPLLTRLKKFRGAYAASHVNFFYRKSLIETVRYAGWDVHEARLFYFKNPILDYFMNLIAPHIYVVATPKENFKYAEKRLKSLRGYSTYTKEMEEPTN